MKHTDSARSYADAVKKGQQDNAEKLSKAALDTTVGQGLVAGTAKAKKGMTNAQIAAKWGLAQAENNLRDGVVTGLQTTLTRVEGNGKPKAANGSKKPAKP